MNDFPRRSQLELMTPAEIAIREAIIEVEKVGADVLLTEAVILLGNAQNKVADYIDNKYLVWYGPHPCQKCDPNGKKETMIVKAGNGADNELEFDFVHDSQYPNHKWQKHKCLDITK